MMRSRSLLSVLVPSVLLVSVVAAGAPEKFGAGVTLSDVTPIVKVLQEPTAFAGRPVRVEGVVTAVCTAMGCWMALAPADQPTGKTMLIQVDHDGVIVFPVTAKGHRAEAEGVLERINGGEGQEAASELAAQQGEKGEKKSAPAQWRIKATGAVVY